MARKRKPHKPGPRHRKPAKLREIPLSELPPIPDRRALEGTMWQAVAEATGAGPRADTPLARAQDIMYRAFGEPNPDRKAKLAREALEISPDCADAYVLLAEQAPRRKEALKLYEQGVAAGERALGPAMFQEATGHFWGLLETRPYMRARLGLAHALWTAGRRPEAIRHLQEMLRLNPNDNQGLRYTLAGFLLSEDRDDDLAQLLNQYPDEGTAAWAWTRALRAFRRQGDSAEARRLLKEGQEKNKHIADYLLGRKYPPMEQPASYTLGSDEEALEYVGSFLAGWKATAGAVTWLREHDPETQKDKAKTPPPKGPLAMVRKWLKQHVPQEHEGWIAEYRRLPTVIRIAGAPVRPWVVVVMSAKSGMVLGHELADEEPSSALLWDAVAQAMKEPLAGRPRRPVEIAVRLDERWEQLRPHFEEIGVELVATEAVDALDGMFHDLGEHMGGKALPGLLEVPGVSPEQLAGFYDAAAFYFREAPWRRVGYESAIRVRCDKFRSGPWYAVVMGQSGLTMGLALYEDLNVIRRTWSRNLFDEENARETVATTVTFGAEAELPPADADAIREHGWPVARPDAYPSIFHKERGMSTRQPLAWELELVEGCLRAIPGFVTRRPQDDPTPETVPLPVASGELRLELAWVIDEQT